MLKQKINEDLKSAMKSGDSFKRDVLRFLDSAVKNIEIEKKKRETGLDDAEILEVIARLAKQRKDSIEQYEKGGRADLVEKEKKELEILMQYMPQQLSEDELRVIVKETISAVGATSASDVGKVMGVVMGKVKGKTDGNAVKKIVGEELK